MCLMCSFSRSLSQRPFMIYPVIDRLTKLCKIISVYSLVNKLMMSFNRDNRIDFGLLLQQSIKHGKPIPKINIDNVGFASVLGRRTYNEDFFRFVLKEFFKSSSLLIITKLQSNRTKTKLIVHFDHVFCHIRWSWWTRVCPVVSLLNCLLN